STRALPKALRPRPPGSTSREAAKRSKKADGFQLTADPVVPEPLTPLCHPERLTLPCHPERSEGSTPVTSSRRPVRSRLREGSTLVGFRDATGVDSSSLRSSE